MKKHPTNRTNLLDSTDPRYGGKLSTLKCDCCAVAFQVVGERYLVVASHASGGLRFCQVCENVLRPSLGDWLAMVVDGGGSAS